MFRLIGQKILVEKAMMEHIQFKLMHKEMYLLLVGLETRQILIRG